MTDVSTFIQRLGETRRKFDAKDDEWRYSVLLAVRELLQGLGVERRLLDPIQMMVLDEGHRVLNERAKGEGQTAARSKLSDVAPWAYSAAAVTYLKIHQGLSLDDALIKVAGASGINKEELKKYRKDLQRGPPRVPQTAKSNHDAAMKEFNSQSYNVSQICEFVGGLAKYLSG